MPRPGADLARDSSDFDEALVDALGAMCVVLKTHFLVSTGDNTFPALDVLLEVPPVGQEVGEEWRGWQEGECIVFDDSWEHEVFHKGNSDRIVLLINFWHPDLPASERRIQLNTHGYEPI